MGWRVIGHSRREPVSGWPGFEPEVPPGLLCALAWGQDLPHLPGFPSTWQGLGRVQGSRKGGVPQTRGPLLSAEFPYISPGSCPGTPGRRGKPSRRP